MSRQITRTLLLVAVVTGCVGPSRPCIDGVVCDLALPPRDARMVASPATLVTSSESPGPGNAEKSSLIERLIIPAEIPGADAGKLELPPVAKENEDKRTRALKQFYPGLPEVGPETPVAPGPNGQPMTLAQLQALALSNSPGLRQAVARVEAARGDALQAGLPPNPTVGFVGNTIGTGGSAGQTGGYFAQAVKLGNKLGLSRAVAAMDLRLAEIALRKTEMDLLTSVRRAFFKVLVARESVRIVRAIERLANRVLEVQVEQLIKGGEVAPYEPMQTRIQVTQARAALVQARFQGVAAWKQLASAVGLPGLPITELAANLQDMPLPVYDYQAVLDHVLRAHTDLLSGEAGILKARHAIALAKVANIPDLDVNIQLTPDFSTPKYPLTPTVQIGFVGLPVWNRNQGAIARAEAELIAADEALPAARNDLTARLAEAYARYAASRTQAVYLRDGAIPDQIRVYQAIRDRYLLDPSIPDSSQPNFQDVINAQQNLGQLLSTYLSALDGFVNGLVDVADLLQTDDLYLLSSGRSCIGPLGLCLAEEIRPCSPIDSRPLLKPSGAWTVYIPALPGTHRTAPEAPKRQETNGPEKKSETKKPETLEVAPRPQALPELPGVTLPPLEGRR